MMPTFPLPPLKFRKAGFPRYGFNVYSRAFDGLVTRAVAKYHYSANWETCTGGTLTR